MIVWEIAKKDLLRSVRSVFLIVFALVLPLATTGVFYAAFGGMSGGNASMDIPAPRVLVVNQDGESTAARLLADTLTGPDLAGALQAESAPDADLARRAVDGQEAAVAVIIPAGFDAAWTGAGGDAAVTVYQDPALSIGPAIVRAVVQSVMDGFNGGRIAVQTAAAAAEARGAVVDAQTLAAFGAAYGAWAQSAMKEMQAGGWWTESSAAGAKKESADQFATMTSVIMGMMMVFYCFFTGASASQSILQEQEAGTLQRLFTSPIRRSAILGGKLIAVWAIVALQLLVLLAASALAFGIRWGDPLGVTLAVFATATLSAAFGVCLTSFVKSTKQAGLVFGVVVNMVGWLGILRMFGGIMPGMARYSNVTDVISLFSPQGWAARIWQESLSGAPQGFSLAGMLAIAAALFVVGVARFNRRFAG